MATALLLCSDLFWTSKIVETGRALGRPVVAARDVDRLAELARAEPPSLVILDLCLQGIDAGAVVERIRGLAPRARFTAFGRHTDESGLERARAAGCDPVLARSALQARLPEHLGEWLGAGPAGA
jgi:CheY-like chemotaxis protein